MTAPGLATLAMVSFAFGIAWGRARTIRQKRIAERREQRLAVDGRFHPIATEKEETR